MLVAFALLAGSPSSVSAEKPSPQKTEEQTPAEGSQGATAGAPKLAVPGDEKLLAMIRSTLIALNQANATGNYSVFREMSAPGFQVANSSAKLAESFAELRRRNFDLSPILLLRPKLLRRPELNAGGMLRVTGFFPTRPERLNFDLMFQSVGGQWRLFGIAANTSPVETEAPAN